MKRQMKRLMLFACITATTVLGSQSAFAGYGAGGDGRMGGCEQQKHKGHGGMFRKMARELGLTDAQKQQVRTLFEAERQKNKPTFAALGTERRALRDLVHSGSADEGAIRAQSAKVAGLQADLAVARAAVAKQVLALLTPEQAAKFKELKRGRGLGGMCLEQER
ncbi:Spy/CpxP family protein refolding chaperone [Geomonas edaphica]|uniref:Spy/CpxP family protein refolding chaperone n=1 Tax=Geomonas edaphica TaxID=2570226 RepID=UPI0010A7E1AA|nr:Spy/CpxP family protein refolding chaperone [Geomonas edaphica]